MASLDRFREVERRFWQRSGVVPVERRVRLRSGGEVRVLEVGDGPPVLFVHGAANGATSWLSLMAALDGFRCLAFDRPGCGLSDPIVGGPLRDLAAVEAHGDDLVADVLDALELETASVVATSYGGWFALRGAAAHPARVGRLVELSWPLGAPMEHVPLPLRVGAVPGMRAVMARVPVTRRMVKGMLRQVGLARALATGTFDDDMVDWYLSILRDTPTMSNDLRSSPKLVTPVRGLDERVLLGDELLGRIAAPVLFLWGDEDPNGGASVARAFVARVPSAELEVVPRAGHAPWIDEPALCAARTGAFLRA